MTEEKRKNNLKLWNAVCETNPEHTKKVTFGRGFTTIDPMHQIRNATKQFGSAGEGWGWEIIDVKTLETKQIAVLVRLWYEVEGNHIEQWGQCSLYIDKGNTKPDDDCMKKATTDGITKCLSYLGFNADVFLGKFDDNKYVEKMREKFNMKFAIEYSENIKQNLNKIDSLDDLVNYKNSREFKENFAKFPKSMKEDIVKLFIDKKESLCEE